MKKDYLLVGQGIAGSVLAFSLLQAGKSVDVVDNNPDSSSSKIAAGLYNPIVFKRIVKSWMVDEVLPAANLLYADMEREFACKIHTKRDIVKLFVSEDEKLFWQKKSTETNLKNYLSDFVDPNFMEGKIKSAFGSSFVKQSGNVDVALMLKLLRKHLIEKNSYCEEKFEHKALQLDEHGVRWKAYEANKIIFCEGYAAQSNPYFNWLPFVLTKGELLVLRIPNFDLQKVLNKGVFILPLGNDLYKVGATYEWKELNENPSERGKSLLLEKIHQVINLPFDVVEHYAGIRPTVKDRRPLIGLHPQHSQMAVFNGMGTKAILLAPYFALEFIAFLEGEKKLNAEISLERYQDLFPRQN
jgi:glycine oxidase